MVWRWFKRSRKEEEKVSTLEERAKALGIIIGKPEDNGYIECIVRGSKDTLEMAENRLLERAKKDGVKYLSDVTSGPSKLKEGGYLVIATGYIPK